MILTAFGITDYSPHQVSQALIKLNVSHTVEGGYMRHMVHTVDGLSKEQPAWPIVMDKVKAIPRVRTIKDRLIYLVCDSRAALAATNVQLVSTMDLNLFHALKHALTLSVNVKDPWTLNYKEPSILEYVNAASKPSLLNNIQNVIYKITPYAFRKEVQNLVILYLAGAIPVAKLNAKLRSSLKFDALALLMKDPQVLIIREACELHLKKGLTVEDVAKQTGVATFEILYISASSTKIALSP